MDLPAVASVVKGYYEYTDIWNALVDGNKLHKSEPENLRDNYSRALVTSAAAIAVKGIYLRKGPLEWFLLQKTHVFQD